MKPTHILNSKELSAKEFQKLQTSTLYGKEKKSLAYVIGTMNMVLHGIEARIYCIPILLAKTLQTFKRRIESMWFLLTLLLWERKSRGAAELSSCNHETAYLFLQHFIKMLKVGGRCGIVIKNTFLSNTDNASIALRKQLLEECNLHAILDLPGGTFTGAGVKTVVLFFDKGTPTKGFGITS